MWRHHNDGELCANRFLSRTFPGQTGNLAKLQKNKLELIWWKGNKAGYTLPKHITACHLTFWLATPYIQQAACLLVLPIHYTLCHIVPIQSNMLNITNFYSTSFQAFQISLNTPHTTGTSVRIILRAIPLIGVSLQYSEGENWDRNLLKNLGMWTKPKGEA